MAEVRPFRGMHYNGSEYPDLSQLLCPPYDIIPPGKQGELYGRSQNNFIRLEHGRDLPQDTETENRYSRARATLDQWLARGVLQIDREPAIYLQEQEFHHQGRMYRRRGLSVLVRLEEWSRMVVRPHEGTLSEPKGDRLNLLWALRANTSPIFALYDDAGHELTALIERQAEAPPLLAAADADGEAHQLWAVREEAAINEVRDYLAGQPLYIADGHHRYESALAYRNERRSGAAGGTGDEAYEYVMMTLVAMDDPGLLVLPAHRLVRGLIRPTLEALLARLGTFFRVEEFPLESGNIHGQVLNLLRGDEGLVKMLLFGPERGSLFRLELAEPEATEQMMPNFHSEIYGGLDVSIVDHVILEKLLELNMEKEGDLLGYSHDSAEAVRRVLSEEYQIALLLRPVPVKTIKAVADAGERMPRKSTYFHPKLPAGLILHQLA